ncbi:MAG: short chain dehydrogenase [Proteobacteria bacterium]|nr:short chain dehydrogenase [Pseudomonadota bacterium]
MKIIIIGGTGTVGQAVVKELSQRHTLIIAGHAKGDIQMDMTDTHSIAAMYKKVGSADAVVITAGQVKFAPLSEMSAQQYAVGLQSKLMGQVNLVLLGVNYLNEGGSFTLTSGILNQDPIRYGSSAAMVNGALEGFVKSAAIEMPRNIRINVVSPTVLEESIAHYADYFRGFDPVPAAKVALAYSKSVEGAQTGQIYRVGW